MIFTSLVLGVKIRTMWMTPFYTFFGVLFLEIFKKNINLDNFKKFFIFFIVIFLISPFTYLAISLSNDFKRTDFPGKEIARLVQNKWEDNFVNEIKKQNLKEVKQERYKIEKALARFLVERALYRQHVAEAASELSFGAQSKEL